MVNNANGGTLDNLQPGLDWVKKMKQAGSLNLADVTAGTSTRAPRRRLRLVLQPGVDDRPPQGEGRRLKTFVPKGGEIASYYNQVINVDAPHPAAARLFQEYLYSDAGPNAWIKGGASPILYESMKAAGTIERRFRCEPAQGRRDAQDPDLGSVEGRERLPEEELGRRGRVSVAPSVTPTHSRDAAPAASRRRSRG